MYNKIVLQFFTVQNLLQKSYLSNIMIHIIEKSHDITEKFHNIIIVNITVRDILIVPLISFYNIASRTINFVHFLVNFKFLLLSADGKFPKFFVSAHCFWHANFVSK